MGRAPVILSDDWVEPPGPDWSTFAIRVPEKQVADLPRILEEREEEAVERGELARAAWSEWYAKEVAFHRAVESCLALKEERRIPETLARWPIYFQYLRPFHARRALAERLAHLGPRVLNVRLCPISRVPRARIDSKTVSSTLLSLKNPIERTESFYFRVVAGTLGGALVLGIADLGRPACFQWLAGTSSGAARGRLSQRR